jgi:hypothetical protein
MPAAMPAAKISAAIAAVNARITSSAHILVVCGAKLNHSFLVHSLTPGPDLPVSRGEPVPARRA